MFNCDVRPKKDKSGGEKKRRGEGAEKLETRRDGFGDAYFGCIGLDDAVERRKKLIYN